MNKWKPKNYCPLDDRIPIMDCIYNHWCTPECRGSNICEYAKEEKWEINRK